MAATNNTRRPANGRRTQHRPGQTAQRSQAKPVWGLYLPDLKRSLPGQPVQGRIVNGKNGPEFHPDKTDPKHPPKFDLANWITNSSCELLIEHAREEACDAIKDFEASINRLRRFISEN